MKTTVCACLPMLLVAIAGVGRAGAQQCYQSSILSPSPFMGNNDEVLKLADGTLWEVKYEYSYLYAYYPSVTICPGQGKLIVGNKSLRVQLVSGAPKGSGQDKARPAVVGSWALFEETSLVGRISGTVKRGRIFTTASGNVYEVTGVTLQMAMATRPVVTVLRNGNIYRLVVEGFDEPLTCRRLNDDKLADGETQQSTGPSAPSAVEAQISGEFNGWEGETIVKLTNGQVWQQSEYYYEYHYSFMPKVIVYRSGGGYKMKIVGINRAVGVELLR